MDRAGLEVEDVRKIVLVLVVLWLVDWIRGRTAVAGAV